MRAILVIFALMFTRACAIGGIESEIPSTNQVVLNVGEWTPSQGQVQKTLISIQSFLDKARSTDGDTKTILSIAGKYRVQFIGVMRNGQKVIWCNFFPATLGNEDYQNWKRDIIKVHDGGAWFWHIDYNPETEKCSAFQANGFA